MALPKWLTTALGRSSRWCWRVGSDVAFGSRYDIDKVHYDVRHHMGLWERVCQGAFCRVVKWVLLSLHCLSPRWSNSLPRAGRSTESEHQWLFGRDSCIHLLQQGKSFGTHPRVGQRGLPGSRVFRKATDRNLSLDESRVFEMVRI